MLLDFRALDQGIRLEADLCVIGAGAAGITIANALIGSGLKTFLLEGGGWAHSDSSQALYRGGNSGLPYYPLHLTRLRYFGGTTNHWTGLCAPLSQIDFEARSWVPYSGWPIARAALVPYYERAQSILNLGPFVYSDSIWTLLGNEPLRFNADRIRSAFWQVSDPPARLGPKYREAIRSAPNVWLLLNANATNIRTNESGSVVDGVDVASTDGMRATLRARRYILACGGLENPRLLLVSNGVVRAGLGNQHDLVGRFFMEHLHANIADVYSGDYARLLEIYSKHTRTGRSYLAGLRLGETAQRQERVLDSAVEMKLVAKTGGGTQTALDMYRRLNRGDSVDNPAGAVWGMLKDLDGIAYNAYRHFVLGKFVLPPVEKITLFSFGEQSPNPDSRVRLSIDRDALGMPRINLDWRVTDLERRSLDSLVRALGSELARLNVGRVRASGWLVKDDGSWRAKFHGGNHHMGTTRMSDSPRLGVVDRDCRVHGIANLYIAGSSVFPTGGHANPTLTIVALALRLADHMKATSG